MSKEIKEKSLDNLDVSGTDTREQRERNRYFQYFVEESSFFLIKLMRIFFRFRNPLSFIVQSPGRATIFSAVSP